MADAPPLYAAVALNVPMDKLFHYRVPEALRGAVAVGARVRVPFGQREMTGTCVKFSADPGIHSARVRDILGVLDQRAFLDEQMRDLTEWMARYYCCPWGKTLDAVLPSVIKTGAAARSVQWVSAARPAEELLAHAAQIEKRSPRQARILRALAGIPGEIVAGELARLAEADAGVIAKLGKAGFLTLLKKAATDPLLELPIAAHRAAGPDARAEGGARPDPGGVRARPVPRGAAPRRHRQRQDGSLSAGAAPLRRVGPAGDRPRAGDRPHAADGGAVPRAVRPRPRAPQRHHRFRTARALDGDPRRPRRRRHRHALRRLRACSETRPARRGRGTRSLLQAAERAAL